MLSACTWEQHLSRYSNERPQRQYKPRQESIVIKDSLFLDTLACARIKYFSPEDSLLHALTLNCTKGFQFDSIFWNNGHLYQVREWLRYPPASRQAYQLNRVYDRQGRPLWQTTYRNRPAGDVEYRQYFSESGELLPQKQPVYYELLDED